MNSRLLFSLFLASFLCCLSIGSTEFVPVYLWQTSISKGQIPALSHVNSDTFRELIRKIANKNTRIVVFAEENLSPEDFSNTNARTFKYFTNLQNSKRAYLPTVDSPVEVLSEFRENAQVVSINDYVEPMQSNVIIINLNDARDDEDRIDMLQRHSKFIGETYEKLLGEIDEELLAIYTGYHSSWILPAEIKKHRQPRSTEQAGSSKPLIKDAFMFYVSGPATYKSGTDEKLLDFNDIEADGNTFTLKSANGSLKLEIAQMNSGYWILQNVSVDQTALKSESIYAPISFSYHCSDMVFAKGDASLVLPDFQIQYMSNNDSFGDAYDCVGFTTIPIWSGLFVTFILVIILTIGLTMMMDIKTMDRFDDPKGKTIIVNASE